MGNASENGFFAEIGGLCKELNAHVKIVVRGIESEVNELIRSCSSDEKHIENLLERLLDYSSFEEGLALFKRLLRYYFDINPEVTADYVMLYKELYDSEENQETENLKPE